MKLKVMGSVIALVTSAYGWLFLRNINHMGIDYVMAHKVDYIFAVIIYCLVLGLFCSVFIFFSAILKQLEDMDE